MVVLFVLHFCSALAQQKELKFRNFTQEDGLPSNEAYAVFRDSRNYIWMATDQGVVRYNGKTMEHYSLPDNVVFKIREDSLGRVWFFSHTGKLSYFLNEAIHPYRYNDSIAKHIRTLLITEAYVEPDGTIWLNNAGADFKNYKISPAGLVESKDFSGISDSLNIIKIHRFAPDAFFARKWVYPSNAKKVEIIVEGDATHPARKYSVDISREPFNHLGSFSRNGYIYMYAGKLLVRLDPDGKFISRTFPADILAIQPSGDKIWVGTIKNGVNLVDKDLVPIDSTLLLEGLSVTSIAVDYEGGTWFSTLERGVFYIKNILVYDIRGNDQLTQPISRLYNINDTTVLFTNENGVYKMTDGKVECLLALKNDNVSDMFVDNRKRLYLGCKQNRIIPGTIATKIPVKDPLIDTIIIVHSSGEMKLKNEYQLYHMGGHLLQMFDLNKPPVKGTNEYRATFDNSVLVNGTVFFIDSKGNGWFGTTKMLYRVNPTFDKIIPFNPSSPIFQKGITNMRELKNGWYCIGLRFGGIVLMKDTTVIAEITENNGLLSNSVKYIFPQDDMLWVATAKGVSMINIQSYQPFSYKIRNIGKNEGLSNVVIKQLADYRGNILVATGSGIFVIEKPRNFLDKKDPVIPLYINSVNYYLGDTTGISSITVPYDKNRLKINVSAISFNSPEEIKYFYRFQKGDSIWQEMAGNELLLENLPSGSYDLELRAGIPNQERFSEIQKFGITIKAAWWQNGWLKLAALAMLLIAVLVIYKTRITTVTKKANLRTMQKAKMLELEQTALRSQMNPHFIFNSLTSIQQLIVSNKAEQANEHLVKFARLIRKTLELSARPYIRINEEKDYLEEYLVLEQFRIPGEFEFNFEIDPQIDIFHTDIPNMMLQPIVENCIRHGIKHLENRKGLITILMQLTETVIRCTITDNGIGRDHSPENQSNMFFRQKSYGMEIVRKRLELLPGAEQRNTIPEITDLYDNNGMAAGTMVSIELPYKIITHD